VAELYHAVAQAIRQDELCAVVTVLSGDEIGRKLLVRRERKVEGSSSAVAATGSLGHTALDQAALARAAEAMEARRTTRISLPVEEQEWDLLIDVHAPQERLVIVGAVHIAIPLVSFARELGLYTVVIDARPIFATQDRFGHVDELIRSWPDEALQEMKLNESSYVVTLTHDEKLDTPALICALNSPVGYIGALGSKRTHAKRVAVLQEAGVSDQQISRIHAPIGLDLGGRSPGEIALAIMAEIVQVRNRSKEAGR
jgi:xanthine dehydrogenase accessory factor